MSYSEGERAPKVPSVKVCPHCAEELPDEATVCPNCYKDPALAPAWNVPRPDETSVRRLGGVFGPDGVLPTSDQVPSPVERLEPPGTHMRPSLGMYGSPYVVYLLWSVLDDVKLEDARAAWPTSRWMRTSVMRRRCVETRSCGRSARRRPSSGLARIDGELRSVRVAVTAQDLVLLESWTAPRSGHRARTLSAREHHGRRDRRRERRRGRGPAHQPDP
jgi:hypothetical protein